jgi:hypothetical protein
LRSILVSCKLASGILSNITETNDAVLVNTTPTGASDSQVPSGLAAIVGSTVAVYVLLMIGGFIAYRRYRRRVANDSRDSNFFSSVRSDLHRAGVRVQSMWSRARSKSKASIFDDAQPTEEDIQKAAQIDAPQMVEKIHSNIFATSPAQEQILATAVAHAPASYYESQSDADYYEASHRQPSFEESIGPYTLQDTIRRSQFVPENEEAYGYYESSEYLDSDARDSQKSVVFEEIKPKRPGRGQNIMNALFTWSSYRTSSRRDSEDVSNLP